MIKALFSFRGRMKRSDYLLASLGLAIGRVVILIAVLAATRGKMDDAVGFAVRPLLDFAFFWPSAAIVIKRGHDRERPTGYSAILVTVIYAAGAAIGYLFDAGMQNAGGYCFLVVMTGWFYLLIDYGLIEGTRGPNRYGPSPKGYDGPGVDDELAKVFD